MKISTAVAAVRWNTARKKVDAAVSVFTRHGLGFSPSSGVVGDQSSLSKRERTEVTRAADTMTKYSAAYFPDKKAFTPDSAVTTARYTPLNLADYLTAQENGLKQANSSQELGAALKFLQRTVYDARLQSHPNRRLLGLEPEQAQEWSALVESLWNMEKDFKDWDESLLLSYPQLANLAFWLYVAVGEYFAIRRAYGNDSDRLTGISLQIIHPYQVSSPTLEAFYPAQIVNSDSTVIVSAKTYLSDMPEGNYIEHGIEYNAQGQEIAIFLSPADYGKPWTRVPVHTESGFLQVLHGFIQREPGQKRGIPEGATVWHELSNIKDLRYFELNSARINSSLAGTVTADSNAQADGKKPMSDVGWSTLDDQAPVAAYGDPTYSVRQVEGGGTIVQGFTPGYKYTELHTARPNVNIPKYIDSLMEYITPNVSGLSIVTTKQRFDNSYNASKGAIDLSWKNGIEYHLKQFESDFHRLNYAAWLNAKIAAGLVSAPGWDNKYKRAAWSDMSIIIPPKPSLNPLNEAKAGKVRVDEAFSNREYESQQITGTSSEENAERLKFENEKLAEARRPLNQDAIDLVHAKNEPPEQDEDENGNIPPLSEGETDDAE